MSLATTHQLVGELVEREGGADQLLLVLLLRATVGRRGIG